MEISIRPAKLSDAQAIAELHAASWRSAYRSALSDAYLAGDIVADRQQLWVSRLSAPPARQHLLLAECGGELLGFACTYGQESEQWGSYLNNIHVQKTQQGKGIGAALLHATAALCTAEYGDAGLYLWVVQSNLAAQGFYARYGAQNVGVDVWDAPGGTQAPLYRFAWTSTQQLQVLSAV